MIHYHGTPIGGSRQDTARFLLGRHALVSYYRTDDLPIVMEACQSFVLDNGAFSHWRAGKGEVDVAAYHQWVQSCAHHPGLDWALIPDTIDRTERDNVALVTLWLRLGCKAKSVPVWHLHESLEWLEWLTERFEVIALGSSGQWATPGTASWWHRMTEAMAVICDAEGRPRCRLHGLRMMDPGIFTRLPLASADSTNAAVNAGSLGRFGSYLPPTSSQRAAVIAERIEVQNSLAVWQAPPQIELTL